MFEKETSVVRVSLKTYLLFGLAADQCTASHKDKKGADGWKEGREMESVTQELRNPKNRAVGVGSLD